MNYQWQFGDAVTSAVSPQSSAAHVYAAAQDCGPLTASVTVTAGETAITTNLTVSLACPFEALPKPASLKMKSNFAPGKLDTAAFKAYLNLPLGFRVTNTPVRLEVAGIVVPFTLDAKGQALNGTSTIKVAHKGAATSLVWQVTGQLKGDFDATWQNYGLTNATVAVQTNTVPVLLLFDTPVAESFYLEKALLYKATAGKSGSGQ